jgi:phage I-like protein
VGRASRQIALSIAIAGDEPPTEFRIFTAGDVETTKGKFLFDDEAAASVLAEYEAHGIDLMIDYDHASLASVSLDPATAGKAAGWFNLEVRDGELWAVNVRWTKPAADALRAKEWRFMSPAFGTDEDGRITSVLNVAITNLPATRKLEPLMAASITALGDNAMTLEEFLKVCKALGLDMSMSLEDAMAKIKGEGPADADAKTEDAPPPVGDGGADENTEAMGGNAAPPPKEPKDENKDAVAAAVSRLTRITGKDTMGAAVAEVETWRASHVKLETEQKKIASERAALELDQRKQNAAKLVALGAETPHTSGLAKGKLAQRLLDEPLAEQTARVTALLAAKGGKLPAAPVPPVSGSEGAHGLTQREIERCTALKIDPAAYAKKKAEIAARSVPSTQET